MLRTVVSDGSAGVGLAALMVAKRMGLKTSGLRRSNSAIARVDLSSYGLKENRFRAPSSKTRWEVGNSDGTVRIATHFRTNETITTWNVVRELGKPMLDVARLSEESVERRVERFVEWIYRYKIETLNVMGNNEKVSNGIQGWSFMFLTVAFHWTLSVDRSLRLVC